MAANRETRSSNAGATSAIVERMRTETASMLGYDVKNLSFGQDLRLSQAVALRIELDKIQSQQLEGQAVDIARLTSATAQLQNILPAEDQATHDLTRLTDDELVQLGNILAKLNGVDAPAEMPVAAGSPIPDLLQRLNDEVVELRRKTTEQSITLESQRVLIRTLEAQVTHPKAGEDTAQADQPTEPTRRAESAVPAHYLKSGDEPWRPFLIGGSDISPLNDTPT